MMCNQLFSDFYYFKQSAADEAWGITITTTGYQEIPSGLEYPPKSEHPSDYFFRQQSGRILNEYQLVYITKGEGTFSSEHIADVDLQAGSLFMIFPGEWHVYRPKLQAGWHAYWVGFKGNYVDHLIEAGFFNKKKPVYAVGLHENLVTIFCEMMDYSKSESPAYQQRLAGALSHILSQIYAINRSRKFEEDVMTKIVTNAKIIMRENVYKHINPEKIAESLNVGYSLFRRMFKEHTGLAPVQYYQKLRIQKAKELLADPSRTVKEISYLLHFESYYYFSTYFKHKTGYTPSEFKKMTIDIIREPIAMEEVF